MEKIFLDRRFTVNGRKSHIYLDNFIALHDYILEIMDEGYVFENALTEDTTTNQLIRYVRWGGDLNRNTIVNGLDLYTTSFRNLTGFDVKATTGNISIVSSAGSTAIEAQGSMELTGVTAFRIETPLFATKPQGALLQQTALTAGNVEYTPYGLPLTDGTSGQILSTNGSGVVSWQSNSSVLHFDQNLSNTTYPDDGLGTRVIATYTLPASTLRTDQSYIEIECLLEVTGTAGIRPGFGTSYSSVISEATAHTYIQRLKGKLIRTSSTTYYTYFESNTYDGSSVFLNSYSTTNSGSTTWSTPIVININLDLGIGDHVSELKHYLITKFLK